METSRIPLTLADISVTWEGDDGEVRSVAGESLASLLWALEQWISYHPEPSSGNGDFTPLDDPMLWVLSNVLRDRQVRRDAGPSGIRFARSCRVATSTEICPERVHALDTRKCLV